MAAWLVFRPPTVAGSADVVSLTAGERLPEARLRLQADVPRPSQAGRLPPVHPLGMAGQAGLEVGVICDQFARSYLPLATMAA